MNAKKCDRCGRYYDKNSKHVTGTNPTLHAKGVQVFTDFERISQEWDLCDGCLTEFFNWVNTKKEDEE